MWLVHSGIFDIGIVRRKDKTIVIILCIQINSGFIINNEIPNTVLIDSSRNDRFQNRRSLVDL